MSDVMSFFNLTPFCFLERFSLLITSVELQHAAHPGFAGQRWRKLLKRKWSRPDAHCKHHWSIICKSALSRPAYELHNLKDSGINRFLSATAETETSLVQFSYQGKEWHCLVISSHVTLACSDSMGVPSDMIHDRFHYYALKQKVSVFPKSSEKLESPLTIFLTNLEYFSHDRSSNFHQGLIMTSQWQRKFKKRDGKGVISFPNTPRKLKSRLTLLLQFIKEKSKMCH